MIKQFEVQFFWQNHKRKETVSAENGTDARKVIETRYPGARTMEVKPK